MIASRLWLKLFLMVIILPVAVVEPRAAVGISGDALYFSLQPTSPLPFSPSSLLIQSPSFIRVPQGALLSVYLLRGNTLVSTSTLEFQAALDSD
ncbi:MAG: hypothetical protein L0220_32500, partial [Acidobacteria bacterium]|nr:hypothetical protein [Acidobacteriota bacterium]